MVVLVHPPAIWVRRQELEDRACNVVQFRFLYEEPCSCNVVQFSIRLRIRHTYYKAINLEKQTNALDRNSYGQLYCSAFDCTYIYTLGAPLWLIAKPLLLIAEPLAAHSRTHVAHSRTLAAQSRTLCGP